MNLTILMPYLNEALTVESCIQKTREFLDKRSITAEVVVADNGSADGSQSLAQAVVVKTSLARRTIAQVSTTPGVFRSTSRRSLIFRLHPSSVYGNNISHSRSHR
jgi:glycosyltransferase involved in cell wall biosynthesis